MDAVLGQMAVMPDIDRGRELGSHDRRLTALGSRVDAWMLRLFLLGRFPWRSTCSELKFECSWRFAPGSRVVRDWKVGHDWKVDASDASCEKKDADWLL